MGLSVYFHPFRSKLTFELHYALMTATGVEIIPSIPCIDTVSLIIEY